MILTSPSRVITAIVSLLLEVIWLASSGPFEVLRWLTPALAAGNVTGPSGPQRVTFLKPAAPSIEDVAGHVANRRALPPNNSGQLRHVTTTSPTHVSARCSSSPRALVFGVAQAHPGDDLVRNAGEDIALVGDHEKIGALGQNCRVQQFATPGVIGLVRNLSTERSCKARRSEGVAPVAPFCWPEHVADSGPPRWRDVAILLKWETGERQ